MQRRSVLSSWLYSYAILLAITVAISCVGYVVAKATIDHEVIRVNNELLKQLRQGLDTVFVNASNFAQFVGSDSRMESLMSRTDTLAASEHYALIKLLQDTVSYRIADSKIADFFVYLRKSDTVLTSGGLLDPRTFFAYFTLTYPFTRDLTYEEWRRMALRDYTGDYLTFTERRETGEVMARIVYARSYPLYRAKDAEATVMIVLDDQKIMATIGDFFSSPSHIYLILDDAGKVIFSSRGFGGSFVPDERLLGAEEGAAFITVDGQRMAVSHIRSRITSWSYILLMPEGLLWEKSEYFGRVFTVMIALCLVLGAALALYFTRRNYSPVKDLVAALESQAGVQYGRASSEFTFIREVLDRTIREKESIAGRLERQEETLRAHFLRQLLVGAIRGEGLVEQSLRRYGILFPSDRFAVILFDVAIVRNLSEENGSRLSEEDEYGLIKPLVMTLIGEAAGAGATAVVSETDAMPACIVCFRPGADEKGELRGMVERARALLEDKFPLELRAYVSGVHGGYPGIAQGYREAMDVAQLCAVTGSPDVLFHDEVAGRRGGYAYTIEMEYQLINRLKAGDAQASLALLGDILDANSARADTSPELMRCFLVDLVCTMLKALHEVEALHGAISMDSARVEALLERQGIPEMRAGLADAAREMCACVAEVKGHRGDALVRKIMAYVERAYPDPNLSVKQAADAFSYSPAYLIQVFREQVGEGLASYITRVRVEKAIQIMKGEPGITVAALAGRVGYGNTNTFIRAFKKIQGVTPGSIRAV